MFRRTVQRSTRRMVASSISLKLASLYFGHFLFFARLIPDAFPLHPPPLPTSRPTGQPTSQGKKCKKGCPKINVMHNQEPTPKKPEEEMLLLRTTRQITLTDDMKHSLEVEFKSPRNYIPLPEPGPTPSIIIPKEPVILKKLEDKEKKKEVKQ
ncbi:hypothetical protein ALC60_11541 [Trachymyrmex zeteki]|uniref:Uncharacterized protein n=1 Tax=Mycetomoellerius zeteki TaxID=64791 RepID=A0A151WP15_9HYME|nr:hypothetical protein ALC60_11541 [Trachymyrmex zeteki]